MDIHSFGRTPREADRVYRKQVERAWLALVERGGVIDPGVRDFIRDSWTRCLSLGVEPVAQRPTLQGAGAALERLCDSNRELLQAFQNTWRVLGDILAGTQSCLVVADATGTLLEVCGSPVVVDRGARDCLSPGYHWSELSGGTNAIGTAIALNSPAEVHSAEHLLAVAKIWSCSAAPVRDHVDGHLVGVVDVTSFGDSHQQHCLALAVTAAHQIEATLRSRELARAVQLLHWYQSQASRWPHQAAVLLDHQGRVLSANALARTLFGDGRDHTPLERGRPFMVVRGEPTLAHCTAALPRGMRAVALEAHAGRECAWDGGVLVVEPLRGRRRAAAQPVTPAPDPFPGIVGNHPALVEIKRQAACVAQALAPVLLLGEAGVGKTLWAHHIHQASPAANGPWVVVNCAQLPHALAAGELFGDEAGPGGRAGKFEQANGGTLLLAQIDELPVEVQAGVLRLVQENVVVRVGGQRERPLRVRLIATSRHDLDHAVAAGRCRQDLLERLRVLSLRLPALRDHPEDLPALVRHLLTQIEVTYGLGTRHAGPELLTVLAGAPWPGNARELRRLLERLYVLSEHALLTLQHLPADFPRQPPPAGAQRPARAPQLISTLERKAIEAALASHGRNLSDVARRLGISRSTLYRKMQRYDAG
ncbi:MAG: sigma-54-dependent Fis family transcriptional regulator [Gammaproteobacteria bacterium]|nr:sigma-54-dependent Fis family transcriptional regulator [Gammaproteobacteria bacterium]